MARRVVGIRQKTSGASRAVSLTGSVAVQTLNTARCPVIAIVFSYFHDRPGLLFGRAESTSQNWENFLPRFCDRFIQP